jgi:hypothetical protein
MLALMLTIMVAIYAAGFAVVWLGEVYLTSEDPAIVALGPTWSAVAIVIGCLRSIASTSRLLVGKWSVLRASAINLRIVP